MQSALAGERDQFIELCDDWAIPYIGDLVGTRLVHELNRRGRRVDVARTIFYRRRKGTPLVLETLSRDITGWEGTVVESFRRLGDRSTAYETYRMGDTVIGEGVMEGFTLRVGDIFPKPQEAVSQQPKANS